MRITLLDRGVDRLPQELESFGDDVDGRTRLTGTSVCQSVEARDAIISSGMEGGLAETFERLEELLASS